MPERPTDEARRRAAIALAWAGVAAGTAYVAQRLYDWSVAGPIDPLLVLREPHVAYYWRAMVATWWGGTLGALAWGLFGDAARRARAERVLRVVAMPWAIAIAVAAGIWP